MSWWVGGNAALIIGGVILALLYPLFIGDRVVISMGYLFALVGGFSSVISTFIAKVSGEGVVVMVVVVEE